VILLLAICFCTGCVNSANYSFRPQRFSSIALVANAGKSSIKVQTSTKEEGSERIIFESSLAPSSAPSGSNVAFVTPAGTLLTLTQLPKSIVNDTNRGINSGDWKLAITGKGPESFASRPRCRTSHSARRTLWFISERKIRSPRHCSSDASIDAVHPRTRLNSKPSDRIVGTGAPFSFAGLHNHLLTISRTMRSARGFVEYKTTGPFTWPSVAAMKATNTLPLPAGNLAVNRPRLVGYARRSEPGGLLSGHDRVARTILLFSGCALSQDRLLSRSCKASAARAPALPRWRPATTRIE